MEKTDKMNRKPVLLEVAEKLTLAQQEIDEFTLQLALGGAEARDKFEELKRNLKIRLGELKAAFHLVASEDRLRAKIEALEHLMKTAPVKDAVSFEDQKRQILEAIAAIEAEVLKKFKSLPAAHEFVHEVEKLKLKLEILTLKIGLKKFEIKESVSQHFSEARKKVDTLISRAAKRVRRGRAGFTDEIKDAYKHVRKALVTH